tara:strand:- start:27 stop:1007 length:981 start_codon:yes stop_codon:yes gene_type:complete
MRFYLLLFIFYFSYSCFSQVGGVSAFSFLDLNTSPRIIALGGYANVLDEDVNLGIYNPSLINSSMLNKVFANFTNYYSDIFYGDFGYCFNAWGNNIISNIKYIDYGNFLMTDEFSNQIGNYSAGEYLLSLGVSKQLHSAIYIGLGTKLAYSSLYLYNSLSILFDFGLNYSFANKDVIAGIIVKNLGYQLSPYYSEKRESLPLAISIGIANKLAHVPIRWHFNIQHIERPVLMYETNNNKSNLMSNVLRHIVFGTEVLIHKNLNFLFGYNNRLRSEMVIQDRRALVGFSYGIVFKIKRFSIFYSRSLSHISGGISTFGVTTKVKKID